MSPTTHRAVPFLLQQYGNERVRVGIASIKFLLHWLGWYVIDLYNVHVALTYTFMSRSTLKHYTLHPAMW